MYVSVMAIQCVCSLILYPLELDPYTLIKQIICNIYSETFKQTPLHSYPELAAAKAEQELLRERITLLKQEVESPPGEQEFALQRLTI